MGSAGSLAIASSAAARCPSEFAEAGRVGRGIRRQCPCRSPRPFKGAVSSTQGAAWAHHLPEPRRRRRAPTMGGARLRTDRAAAGAAVQRLAAIALPGAGCGSRARRGTVASYVSCSVSPAHYHVSESWHVVRAGHRRGAREGSTLRAKRGAWLPTAPAASRSRFARRLGGSSDLFFGVEPTTESGSSWRRNYERHRRMSWPMSRPHCIPSPGVPFSPPRLAASVSPRRRRAPRRTGDSGVRASQA